MGVERVDDFKKDIQKLDLGSLHAEKVKPTDKRGDYDAVLVRCGGCYRCGGCGGCFRCGGCGGCGGCFRCGGCFGCFFFW
ncbi:heterocycloanthracin/sonorensin family bacteriocin [Alicyclobacillus fastidiosus]|uniref:heterocycloanthracin/sonorensin family bacteriocin n=1 Tax=Alicyclobacillus fastidiosus TaxID=392011 RepID=UPI0034DD1AD0